MVERIDTKNKEVKEYDPENIEVEDHGFYSVIVLPIRNTKAGRDLVEFSPDFPKIRELYDGRIKINSVYDLRIRPGMIAGSHYHDSPTRPKFEVCRVMSGKLILELIDPETREKYKESLLRIQSGKSRVVIIPPGVPHRFVNASPVRRVKYLIYSTERCSPEDEKPHSFD